MRPVRTGGRFLSTSTVLLAGCALLACGEEEDPYDRIVGRVEAPADLDLSEAVVLCCREERWLLSPPLAFASDSPASVSPALGEFLREHRPDDASAPLNADRTFSIRVLRGQVVDLQVARTAGVALDRGSSPEWATRMAQTVADCPGAPCVVGVVGGHGGEARGVRAGTLDVRIVLRPLTVAETLVHVRDLEGRPGGGAPGRWNSLADWTCAETDANGGANLGALPQRDGLMTAEVPRDLADRMVGGRLRATAGAGPLHIPLRAGVPIRVRFDGAHPAVASLKVLDPVGRRGRTFAWHPDLEGVSVVLVEPEWSGVVILADGMDSDEQPFASAQARVSENLTVTLRARR